MKRMKAASIKDAARRIARARDLDPGDVRRAITDAIRVGNLNGGYGFLTFAGILPVNLPDGTKIVVLPDIHVPAHHKLILWAILQFLKDYQPHIVILIGDVADVFALSRWPAPPRAVKNMQAELDQTRRLVDEILEASGCHWCFYIMGNHEDRIRRYLTDPAPGVANIVNFTTREPILSFHGLMGYKPGDPVTFIYDLAEAGGFGGGIRVNDDITFHHGFIVRGKPGASPRADADRFGQSTVHGHTHRLGMTARETTSGTIRAIELGNLVEPTHSYMSYANLLNNWHHGLGAGLVVGGMCHLQPVPIKPVTIDGQRKYAFTYANTVYTQSDR